MTYCFVYDPDQLETFYNCFVREISNSEELRSTTSIKVFLQSRRKYNSSEHQSKATVTLSRRHFELHHGAKEFVKLIRRFEIGLGLYTDRKDNKETILESSSMVLYATSNALSRIEATKKTMNLVVNEGLYQQPKQNIVPKIEMNEDGEETCFMSLDKVFLTSLHQSPITKMQRFDVDTQEPQFIAELDQLLTEERADVIFVIKTRSGYHYVIRTGPFMRKMYEFIQTHEKDISVDKNGMNGLPGTFQGGAKVQLIFAKGEANYNQLPSLLPHEKKHASTKTKNEMQS